MRTTIRFSAGTWRYKINARKLFYLALYRTPRNPIKILSIAIGKRKVEIRYRSLAHTPHTIYLERGR